MPAELTQFYARLYRGTLLDESSTEEWLNLMNRPHEFSALRAGLPTDEEVSVYTKLGWLAGKIHYHHEAGIIKTHYGAFALSIFIRDYPEFPATVVLHNLTAITYDVFKTIHS